MFRNYLGKVRVISTISSLNIFKKISQKIVQEYFSRIYKKKPYFFTKVDFYFQNKFPRDYFKSTKSCFCDRSFLVWLHQSKDTKKKVELKNSRISSDVGVIHRKLRL